MEQIKPHFATRQSKNTNFSLRQIQTVLDEHYGERGAYMKFWCKVTIFAGNWYGHKICGINGGNGYWANFSPIFQPERPLEMSNNLSWPQYLL